MLIPKNKVIEFVKKSIETNETVWHKEECQNLNIIFYAGETPENLYFVQEGILRVFIMDRQSNVEHTIGFVFPNEMYVPAPVFFNWCPAFVGIQAIGKTNKILEINIADWKNLIEKDDDKLMLKYAISIAVESVNEVLKHFVFDAAKKESLTDRYKKLKEQNHPIVNSNIPAEHLASYFQVNKRSMERIANDYIKNERKTIKEANEKTQKEVIKKKKK
ncbi:MAG: cyclic nucleotide-binding domain-containing protein [Firmicutes bacterium]|nr:cyclic nucleotide-binding domain-containing protein [Bacillota bacterium]